MDQVRKDDLLHAMRAPQNPWMLPGAIVAAGLLIAVAVYVDRTQHLLSVPKGSVAEMRPISPTDHTIGNPTAPITIVTYSDIDSSFSKQFQQTMEQLMAEYAPAGKVQWVYRHFPLLDQHPYAVSHAEGAECAASIATPNHFWQFISAVNAKAPGTTQFDPEDYSAVLSTLSLNEEAFTTCLENHTFQAKVGADFDNAMAIGADAAPYTVILIEGQESQTISGAVPYDTMKQIIRQAIAKTTAAP